MTETADLTTDLVASTDHLFGLVDPHELSIGDNVRDAADLDEDFIDSIRQHGVLVPVTVVREVDAGNRLVVRDGQRRTLAARAAGLNSIPVYVLATAADDHDQRTQERVIQQIVANDQHAALNDAQRARGIQQLIDAGLTVAKTAKLLSKPRKVVKAAAEAAKSQAAMDALNSGQLSLAQAAAVSEFGDDEEAVGRLIASPPAHFEHLLARMRRERETQRALEEATATYEKLGYRILEQSPRWNDPDLVRLEDLQTAAGAAAGAESVTDPAHWAVLLVEEERFYDVDTDTPVDEDAIDWDTRWMRSAQPQDGARHFDTVVSRWTVVPEWFCTDLPGAGLTLTADAAERRERSLRSGVAATPPTGNGAAGDDEKDARRTVMALNKLGEAATEVRRRWIRENLLSAKKLPKGAATFIATMLVRERGLLGDFRAAEEAAGLLGLSGGAEGLHKHLESLGANSDGPAQMLTFALVLGALEGRCAKDSWRDGGRSWHGAGPRDLLAYLVGAGYAPADIELVILGEKKAEEC
jgi:ParB family chromosome partitioning protein